MPPTGGAACTSLWSCHGLQTRPSSSELILNGMLEGGGCELTAPQMSGTQPDYAPLVICPPSDFCTRRFGRSHRSNQESAPVYCILMTNFAGEKRFASAISRRLRMQGALLRSDRNAVGAGSELKPYDIDNSHGLQVQLMCACG